MPKKIEIPKLPEKGVFLNNEEDYIKYKSLKPVKYIINTKVRFICSICGEEKTKCFKALKFPFICKNCSNRNGQLNPLTKQKKEKTCLLNHGVKNCFQSKEKMDKAAQTKLEKHNDANYNNRPKAAKTCMKNLGVTSPAKSKIVQDKMKHSCMEHFGFDNYFKTPECRKKSYEAIVKKFGKDRLISKPEKEFQNYITSIYKNKILFNTRDILDKGLELDVYLPKLKLAFEFDGIYWHADKRFYKPDFIVKLKRNLTAAEIWANDEKKNLLCIQKGITLIRVKEYDWKKEKDIVKNEIYNIIQTQIKMRKNKWLKKLNSIVTAGKNYLMVLINLLIPLK